MHSVYCIPKFRHLGHGLKAYILRMGNLTSRFSEGKFQQNHFENAFVNRFKSFFQIGCIPDYMLKNYVEFTPIDYCGDAIIDIANHYSDNFAVFHLLNEKHVTLDRLYEIFRELNIKIEVKENSEFINKINELLKHEDKREYLKGIINDFNEEKQLIYESNVKIKSDFTKQFLEKIGFEWPYIGKEYIRIYLKYLADIGYFNVEIN